MFLCSGVWELGVGIAEKKVWFLLSDIESVVPHVSRPLLVKKTSILRNKTLLAVSLVVFAAYTGIGMVTPVRVLYAQSRGASLAVIGAMGSAYLISNFLFQYPTGWLADRWGRKPVMIVGLLVQAALTLAYIPITDPIAFIVLRFFEGIAGAALLPPARALIIDTVPSDQQGEAYGVFGAFFSAGFLLGPGIGGLIAAWGFMPAFFGAIFFRIVAIVIVVFMIKPKNRTTPLGATSAPPVSYQDLFSLPLLGAYVLAFGDYVFLGFDITLLPLWMHDHLGASVFLIGMAYVAWSLPNTILSPIGGRIADRMRRSVLIFIFGLAQVPLYIASGLSNSALLVVLFFGIQGVLYAFIQPAVDAHVAASSASTMRARVQGMYSTIGLIGSFVGATGFVPLYSFNFRLPLIVMGLSYGTCVLIGGTMIRIYEKRKLALVQ